MEAWLPTILADQQTPTPEDYQADWQTSRRITEAMIGNVAPGVSYAYGSYVQLTAGLPYDAFICAVGGAYLSQSNKAELQTAIGVGLAGSEQIISEVKFGIDGSTSHNSESACCVLPFPLFIPAGTRVAMKSSQGAATAGSTDLAVTVIPASACSPLWPTFVVQNVGKAGVQGYKPINSLAAGITVTSASSVWGSWAVISAGLAKRSVITSVQVGSSASNGDSILFMQAGYGASGVEVPTSIALFQNYGNNVGSQLGAHGSFLPPVIVPAGTPISGRSMSNSGAYNRNTDFMYVPVDSLVHVSKL